MSKITLLVWTLVILIINKDASGDVTIVEETKRLKLTVPDLPGDRNVHSNSLDFQGTILDFIKRKLGVADKKSSRTKNKRKPVKKQSQINPTKLAQSSKKKAVTKYFKTANNDPLLKKYGKSVADFQESNFHGNERQGCKEGRYMRRDCNICMCMGGRWNCTTVVCEPGLLAQKNSISLYRQVQVDATNCKPGEKIEDDHGCPCTCVIPSVMVCDICPAVENIIIPGKTDRSKTTVRVTTEKTTVTPIYEIEQY